jgi:IMP dehydrogenase
MDTICGYKMCISMDRVGSIGILHRYQTPHEQEEDVKAAIRQGCRALGIAIGSQTNTYDTDERLAFVSKYPQLVLICIDVAHAHHKFVRETCILVKQQYPQHHLMVGNVSTWEGYKFLQDLGVDSVRVGIGCGSVCLTQSTTGHGNTIVNSLMKIKQGRNGQSKPWVIADGGIKTSGDVVKCLALGADAVMSGWMLRGTLETPNRQIYRGMASEEAKRARNSEEVHYVEGKTISTHDVVNRNGQSVVQSVKEGIQSGLSYSGCWSLDDFHRSAILDRLVP